ncbi:hypothetical protein UCRPC4_g03318 [Phaeomoniella chlamydospora]|uniref:Uncharacterized protein n=1 Tax=Phaeomoniella chlamydospora TaxID=158046 RepID=A0A0G2H0E2_PHACM|nr:hypothetical protein UCRPC4_g03318 [Phaeomoniella chlamydospora]
MSDKASTYSDDGGYPSTTDTTHTPFDDCSISSAPGLYLPSPGGVRIILDSQGSLPKVQIITQDLRKLVDEYQPQKYKEYMDIDEALHLIKDCISTCCTLGLKDAWVFAQFSSACEEIEHWMCTAINATQRPGVSYKKHSETVLRLRLTHLRDRIVVYKARCVTVRNIQILPQHIHFVLQQGHETFTHCVHKTQIYDVRVTNFRFPYMTPLDYEYLG